MTTINERGFSLKTLLYILLIIALLAILIGGIKVAIEDIARANVESVEILTGPMTIANGRSGTITVEIKFDRKAPERQHISLQLWEDDSWGNDLLINTGLTLPKGQDAISGPITLQCSSNGYLNGDTDDGNHLYHVYAYVIDQHAGTAESANDEVRCGGEE